MQLCAIVSGRINCRTQTVWVVSTRCPRQTKVFSERAASSVV